MTKMLPLSLIYTENFLEGPRDSLQILTTKLEAFSIKLASSGPCPMLTYIYILAQRHRWPHFSL